MYQDRDTVNMRASRSEPWGHSLRIDVSGQEPEEAVPRLIDHAAGLHVSDLFFNTNEDRVDVGVRHLGILRYISSLSPDLGRRCISFIKTVANMNISERRRPMDGRWLYRNRSGGQLDLRVNTIPTLHGEDCTLRILDQGSNLLSLDQLGIDAHVYPELVRILKSPSGLVLVTGPTETGKSTTLYACLSHINTGDRKINTIEDPIEYSLQGIRQSQVNTTIDVTFDELLRNVLRQAPDVIMIGEIRDRETAMTAVRAAGSGHLVLSTLHAPVASAAIHSMLRLEVHPYLLSTSLLAVVSQRLLRKLCPRCKEPGEQPPADLFVDIKQWLKPGEGERLYEPRGCQECHMTGYTGRIGVFEVLPVSPAIRALIDDKAPVPLLRKKAVEEGMVEFRHSAMLKVGRGDTSMREITRVLPAEYLVHKDQ